MREDNLVDGAGILFEPIEEEDDIEIDFDSKYLE